MTARSASLSMDGSPISQADIERMREEERLLAERQRKATRVIAGAARDLDDARTLLDMLGLGRDVVLAARKECAAPAAAPRRRNRAA